MPCLATLLCSQPASLIHCARRSHTSSTVDRQHGRAPRPEAAQVQYRVCSEIRCACHSLRPQVCSPFPTVEPVVWGPTTGARKRKCRAVLCTPMRQSGLGGTGAASTGRCAYTQVSRPLLRMARPPRLPSALAAGDVWQCDGVLRSSYSSGSVDPSASTPAHVTPAPPRPGVRMHPGRHLPLCGMCGVRAHTTRQFTVN